MAEGQCQTAKPRPKKKGRPVTSSQDAIYASNQSRKAKASRIELEGPQKFSQRTNLDPPTHWEPPFSGVRAMHPGRLLDSSIEMASAHIKLDPQTIEAIARRVVELLERRGMQQRELVDATELARRFGIERSWVYSHAIELGAVKLGDGAKPRLRFDPQVAMRVLRRADEGPAADPPTRSGERAGQLRAGGASEVVLLPVRGKSGLPPAA